MNGFDKLKQNINKKPMKQVVKIFGLKIHNENRFITRLSLIYVIIVLIIKSITQLQTNSIAFFSEFIDSILDFTTVTITWLALKFGNKEPDFDHMFGHYKINSFGGLVEAILTILIYLMILNNALLGLLTIFGGGIYKIKNSGTAVESLLIVIIINLFVSGIILKIGRKNQNQTILAQGANFKGDLYRNISVIVGLLLVELGFDTLDPIIAVIFSMFAIRESLLILKDSFKELTDYNAISEVRISELKKNLLEIKGISKINSLSIRTAGNFADIDMKITLGSKESIYSMTRINNKIIKLIEKHFPEYECNTIIQIISQESQFIYQDVMNIIKDIGENSEKCENIHGIFVDILEHEVLIQFHVLFSPNLSLSMAHEYISDIETKVRDKIKNRFPSKKITIITHIESSENRQKECEIKNIEEIDENLRNIVIEEINKIPEIKGFHHLNLITENDGIFITIHIKLDGSLKIRDAHLICELLELNIKVRNSNINRVVIHPEPVL